MYRKIYRIAGGVSRCISNRLTDGDPYCSSKLTPTYLSHMLHWSSSQPRFMLLLSNHQTCLHTEIKVMHRHLYTIKTTSTITWTLCTRGHTNMDSCMCSNMHWWPGYILCCLILFAYRNKGHVSNYTYNSFRPALCVWTWTTTSIILCSNCWEIADISLVVKNNEWKYLSFKSFF